MINIEDIFSNIQKSLERDILKNQLFEGIYKYFSQSNILYIEQKIKPSIEEYFSKEDNIKKFEYSLKIFTINSINLKNITIPQFKNLSDILDFLENDFNFKNEVKIFSENGFDPHLLKYSYILKIFYIFWHRKINYDYIITDDTSQITEIYGDFYKDNRNFNSYYLLPFDKEYFNLIPANQILVDSKGNYLNIYNLSVYFLEFIYELIEKKYIKDISFKIMPQNKQLNKIRQTGSYFNTEINKINDASIFYDYISNNNSMDRLIIIHDKEKNEITFEELVSDYIDFQDEYILTQVIHLKYFTDDKNDYFIEHIDHEYIRYSYENYDRKEKKIIDVKGEKKFKTFKIDKSMIPLSYKNKNDQYFITVALFSFFHNKKLISEYFSNMDV